MNRVIYLAVIVTGVLTILTGVTMCSSSHNTRQASALPAPDTQGKVPLETTLTGRRSVRSFKGDPLTKKQISQLC